MVTRRDELFLSYGVMGGYMQVGGVDLSLCKDFHRYIYSLKDMCKSFSIY